MVNFFFRCVTIYKSVLNKYIVYCLYFHSSLLDTFLRAVSYLSISKLIFSYNVRKGTE